MVLYGTLCQMRSSINVLAPSLLFLQFDLNKFHPLPLAGASQEPKVPSIGRTEETRQTESVPEQWFCGVWATAFKHRNGIQRGKEAGSSQISVRDSLAASQGSSNTQTSEPSQCLAHVSADE